MNAFKKLQRNKRGGVSVVIGMLMAMTIVFSLATNIFIWEQNLQQEAQQRAAEKFTIDKIFTSSGITHFFVSNIGTITIHLVGLWINETRYAINYMVNSAESIDVAENLSLTESITFDCVIVTERGLAVAAEYSLAPTAEVQASGVFKINWFYFKYTSVQKPTRTDAMTIPSTSTYVALYMKFVNNWIYPVKVKARSFACWTVPMPEVYMFIVQSVAYPIHIISAYTSEITINPNQEVELVFASTTNGVATWQWDDQIPNNLIYSNPSHTAALSATIFYEMNGQIYGQVLNAQGVYFP